MKIDKKNYQMYALGNTEEGLIPNSNPEKYEFPVTTNN